MFFYPTGDLLSPFFKIIAFVYSSFHMIYGTLIGCWSPWNFFFVFVCIVEKKIHKDQRWLQSSSCSLKKLFSALKPLKCLLPVILTLPQKFKDIRIHCQLFLFFIIVGISRACLLWWQNFSFGKQCSVFGNNLNVFSFIKWKNIVRKKYLII